MAEESTASKEQWPVGRKLKKPGVTSSDSSSTPSQTPPAKRIDPKATPDDPKNIVLSSSQKINLMEGGTQNTAGGKMKPLPTFTEALTSIKLSEFKEVHKKPCVRDGLLVGIGGGAGIGGLRAVLGGGVWRASNWAAWSFVGLSVVSYNYCLYRRSLEKRGMKRATEIMDLKRKQELEKKRERDRERKAKEEEKRREEDERRRRDWYKFWK